MGGREKSVCNWGSALLERTIVNVISKQALFNINVRVFGYLNCGKMSFIYRFFMAPNVRSEKCQK